MKIHLCGNLVFLILSGLKQQLDLEGIPLLTLGWQEQQNISFFFPFGFLPSHRAHSVSWKHLEMLRYKCPASA